MLIKNKNKKLTSSFRNGTPTAFTMDLDVVNELLVFLLGPSTFIYAFLVTTRFSHCFLFVVNSPFCTCRGVPVWVFGANKRLKNVYGKREREWKPRQIAEERLDIYL